MHLARKTLIGALMASTAAVLAGSGAAGAAPPAPLYAFGAEVQVGGRSVVPPTPAVAVTPMGDDAKTTINIPASPIVVNGTLTARANAHPDADITTGLTVVPQTVDGPYRSRALAQIEDVGVLYVVAGQTVPLVSAALVRAEAAAVCGATPGFTAASEIIDLRVGGQAVPLNAPVQSIIDGITQALDQTGLNAVVDVQRNVVTTPPEGGIAVDGLVVTILSAAGDNPLAVVRLAHAELSAGACAPRPQCSDAVDNDGDAVIDAADPGCHTDGDATNAASYDPNDDSELDDATLAAGELPRTGSASTAPLVAAGFLGLAGLAALVRRRISAT